MKFLEKILSCNFTYSDESTVKYVKAQGQGTKIIT